MLFAILFLCTLCLAKAFVYPPEVDQFINSESFQEDDAKLWVLIAAGSNGWDNYRHQADAYHAYQIMKRHGIPDSQIIVMHYDDIAHNDQNPTPGTVINHPDGSDVYQGVLKDYTGDDVSAVNFLNILTGNATSMQGIGSGKVIASGPNDFVFVNFVDHGAQGIVAFPNDELAAADLISAIQWMYQHEKYTELLLYFEACESGSMFDGLPNNINAFAVTASNDAESSYACYWDNSRGTYLGDVFSVNWMEDCDKEKLSDETIQQQFDIVRKETNTSHVMEFGELKIGNLDVGDFMGDASAEPIFLPKASKADAIPQEQVYMRILNNKIESSETPEEKNYWIAQVSNVNQKRMFLMGILRKIAAVVARSSSHANSLIRRVRPLRGDYHHCLHAANKHFSEQCFSLAKNQYALFNAPRMLANACMDGVTTERLLEAMDFICSHQPIVGIH